MPRTVMSDALFNKISSELSSKDIRVFVLYHGGEPFLNKSIFGFIEELRRTHPNSFIKVVSNGMLFDDELAEKVCNSSLDCIEFSLDGLSPDQSEYIRRGSDSTKTINAINKLLQFIAIKESPLKVAISTTQFFDEKTNGQSPLDNDPPVPEWLINSLDGAHEFKSTWAMAWPRMMIDDEFSIVEYDDEAFGDLYTDICDHLANTITIRANGDVVPCCYDLMSDLSMGNILDSSIAEVWNSPRYDQLRLSITQKTPPETCSSCNVIRKKKRFLVRRISS